MFEFVVLAARETLINRLHERIASLCGTCILAYLVDISRLLRSVRLSLSSRSPN
jgi:hypothetical protein